MCLIKGRFFSARETDSDAKSDERETDGNDDG